MVPFFILQLDGTGLVSAFGTIPDPNCSSCIAHAAYLNGRSGAAHSPRCSRHLQTLLLNVDLPTSTDKYDPPASNSHMTITRDEAARVRSSSYIPQCYLVPFDRAAREVDNCKCFISTDFPIGSVQVGVCTVTGQIRLAWASPDAQIKVLTCSFETPRHHSDLRLYSLPKARVFGGI